MLMTFRFENYKSFQDEAILDMEAYGISELSNQTFECASTKLLRSAGIFGPNAAGKSNVIDAFRFFRKYVLNSFEYGNQPNTDDKQRVLVHSYAYTTKLKQTTFELEFVLNGDDRQRVYKYGFSILKNEIRREWLDQRPNYSNEYTEVFERIGNNIDIHDKKIIDFKDNIEKSLNTETLVLSLGSKLKVALFEELYAWFLNCEIIDFGDPRENEMRLTRFPKDLLSNSSMRRDLLKFLSSFDNSIKNVIFEKSPLNDKEYKIYTCHLMDNGEDMKMLMQDESQGTQKMFALYGIFQRALTNGSLLFVDELNSTLHPILMRTIIQMFGNNKENSRNAQIVFTTNDATILYQSILRRDQIWFVNKDNQKSELYSLYAFGDDNRIRKDESYFKNYLFGKYGAIPKMKSLSISEKGTMYGDNKGKKKS